MERFPQGAVRGGCNSRTDAFGNTPGSNYAAAESDSGRAFCSAHPTATGNAVFPNAVSPKYSGESAGKARMQTCLDQYRANKVNGGNGGLKWIEKGGGYYSECNKRLKGAA